MAKTYIGRAFGNLTGTSQTDSRIYLSMRIASALSDMPAGTVRTIDSALNFSSITKSFNTRGSHDPAYVADLRRCTLLISRTVQNMVARPDGAADSWDDDVLGKYQRSYLFQANAKPTGTGFYLGPSFWAYSEHAERVQAKDAWAEALRIGASGIKAINAKNGTTAMANLYRTWFGSADSTVVRQRLETSLLGMRSQRTGLCYGGTHAAGNAYKLSETGFKGDGGVASVAAQTGWGAAKHGKPVIALHTNFFNASETSGLRTTLHDRTLTAGMQVSRGGAVLHEATHLFAQTHDVKLSNAVYTKAVTMTGDQAEKDKINTARVAGTAQGYGPFTCAALAAADPDGAANNADNYRLFCEDAFAYLDA